MSENELLWKCCGVNRCITEKCTSCGSTLISEDDQDDYLEFGVAWVDDADI